MLDFFDIFTRGQLLPPHGYCLLWDPALVWTHVIADSLIAAAYFSIPLALVRYVTRRRDIRYGWIFWLFALFIVACGTTHLMSIWTLWNPDYGFEALIKVITALASMVTAIVLWPLIPKALALPSPRELATANAALSERVRERDEAVARLTAEVAERQRAEAALVQAQKIDAVGQLTGGIAHDFNNLLQAVSGMLALIARQPDNVDKVKTWSEHGLRAVERGTKLAGQLLAFSRVQKLDVRPIPVGPTVGNMLDMLSRTIGTAVRIETRLADGGALALTDRTQFELALLNLAINARDAMPKGGTLTIATARLGPSDEHPGGAVEIRVSDTGAGMAPEVMARAFEPFYTTKPVGEGTGLGLSMVYGVVRQSGGSIRIESSAGKGTTIVILLSTVGEAGPAAEPAAPAGRDSIPPGDGQTILVVDDNADVRASIRQMLESLGYRVDEAADGATALAQIAQAPPALAIVDYAMPGMMGDEVAREAKARWPGLPIAFATGYAESEALERVLGKGAPILRKPFRLEALAQFVDAMLSQTPEGGAVVSPPQA